MIGILIACSPPIDGSEFICPPPDVVCSSLDCSKPITKPQIIEDKDFTNPWDRIRIPIWRKEFKNENQ